MYFVKRGILQVIVHGSTVKTFENTGYFGEISLITDEPRTADIYCVSNCMLLSLSSTDLEEIKDMLLDNLYRNGAFD